MRELTLYEKIGSVGAIGIILSGIAIGIVTVIGVDETSELYRIIILIGLVISACMIFVWFMKFTSDLKKIVDDKILNLWKER
jgi:hypothetical protein